jgi:hypothetical protein
LVAGLVAALLTAEVRAASKEVKFTKEWKGSVSDEGLQKEASEFITDATALEKLWTGAGHVAGEGATLGGNAGGNTDRAGRRGAPPARANSDRRLTAHAAPPA